MATANDSSGDFSLDASVFTDAKLTLRATTDADATAAILSNSRFPDRDIALGHISLSADTGKVSIKPDLVEKAEVSFDLHASTQSGLGVYGKFADAIKALNLAESPDFEIPYLESQRYLLMDWGYSASFSGSGSHPIGLLGTVTFGVDAKHESVFVVLHRFKAGRGARDVIEDTLASWRLPRQVEYDGHDLNLKPGTWLLAEADGSLAFSLGASLGWNMSFAKEARLLGVTHDLSAKIDASLAADLDFRVSGRYVLVVGREDEGTKVRVRLYKQSSKGLNFGFNLSAGMQGADPQLSPDFHDFVQSVFGMHGLQVLNDLSEWTNPSTDLGQKLAGLTEQTALKLLKGTTGNDPTAELDKAKQMVADALDTWSSLPGALSSMLWSYLGKQTDPATAADFKAFLSDLADPKTGADALAKALQKTTFGDTPEGQFLEAVADKGLLELANRLGPLSTIASKALDVLDGGVVARLQGFINQKLDLNQIGNAHTDRELEEVDEWLKNRLANFLDKAMLDFGLGDLRNIRRAIATVEGRARDYYKTAEQALTKRYSVDFAATYQRTTAGSALIDVNFDMSVAEARDLFADVVAKSDLNRLLAHEMKGVTLNHATLTHEINRKCSVELHMPFFDFRSTDINDAMASLKVEDDGGRVLLYQFSAQDKTTVANRAASQLSVLGSLRVTPEKTVQLASDSTIAYEMRQAKANMRPIDLEECATPFIHEYLEGLFGGGDASVRSFYADLDNAIAVATGDQSNHLGDVALSMQMSLPSSILSGWFQQRDASQLRADQMQLSRDLQGAWRNMLPAVFFQELNRYHRNESVAALLVWASLPVSTSIDFENSRVKQFNTDRNFYWDYNDVDLRRAVARDAHTAANLARRLSGIHALLVEAGSRDASSFKPSMAGELVEMALNAMGDVLVRSLLYTEQHLVAGATDALKQISSTLEADKTAPAQAIKTLSEFAADLTDTFNQRLGNEYLGKSGRVVGPMLLVESSRSLGSPGLKPAAVLTLYALKPGHTFQLGTFVEGVEGPEDSVPPSTQVAVTQTLVSPK